MVGIGLLYPGVLVRLPRPCLSAIDVGPFIGLLICVVGVATSLVVVHQTEATTLTLATGLIVPRFGAHVRLLSWQCDLRPTFGIDAIHDPCDTLCHDLVAWAMLRLAFPGHIFARRLPSLVAKRGDTLCGGMLVLDYGPRMLLRTLTRVDHDIAGSVGLFQLIVSALTLLATLLDRICCCNVPIWSRVNNSIARSMMAIPMLCSPWTSTVGS